MSQHTDRRIAVVGTRNWLHVTAHLLRLADLDARVLDTDRKWVPFRMAISKTVRSSEFAHMVWGGDVRATLVARCLLRKRIVWHWIGSDVLACAKARAPERTIRRRLADAVVEAHFADSPQLAQELADLGIEATVCRLLPPSIEADPMPLPDTFRVLSYWTDDKPLFYGAELVYALARRMTDVEFLIAGAHGTGAPKVPNVRYLGRVRDMNPVYAMTTVFVRVPEHDSLSAMVLEALARGRYVVCNREFPCCHHAITLDDVAAALDAIRRNTEPNRDGARMVRKDYSLQNEANALRRVYETL